MKYIIDENNKNKRIDKYLVSKSNKYSRTNIQKFINEGKILVNENIVKPNYLLQINDVIKISEDDLEEKIEIIPNNLNVEIIYQDEHIAVINKPVDMIVHPSNRNESDTLVNSLKYQLNSLSSVGEDFRPGIVHRLDKDTSGIMIIAKSDEAYINLIEQFKEKKVRRFYMAVVRGYLNEKEARIDLPIGRDTRNRTKMAVTKINSKEAITLYKVIYENNNYSFLDIELLTGRMHQIRVHMSYFNHPVVGDEKYSDNYENIKYQLLHAYKINFNHPVTGINMTFETEIPERINNFLKGVLNYEYKS